MKILKYTRKTTTIAALYNHLELCSKHYVPELDTRVNLNEYAKKLFDYAETFECWDENHLVGLLAIYCNDKASNLAFISNLSVTPDHYKQNIASQLLENCIEYASMQGFISINLEVHVDNIAALNLYKKYKFFKCLHDICEKPYYIQMRRNFNS